MRIKTSELEGVALDWAVAQTMPEYMEGFDLHKKLGLVGINWAPSFSTVWSEGGPLIEKYGIRFLSHGDEFVAIPKIGDGNVYGAPDHLTAAMRSIVAAELGDEVDVPSELLEVSI